MLGPPKRRRLDEPIAVSLEETVRLEVEISAERTA